MPWGVYEREAAASAAGVKQGMGVLPPWNHPALWLGSWERAVASIVFDSFYQRGLQRLTRGMAVDMARQIREVQSATAVVATAPGAAKTARPVVVVASAVIDLCDSMRALRLVVDDGLGPLPVRGSRGRGARDTLGANKKGGRKKPHGGDVFAARRLFSYVAGDALKNAALAAVQCLTGRGRWKQLVSAVQEKHRGLSASIISITMDLFLDSAHGGRAEALWLKVENIEEDDRKIERLMVGVVGRFVNEMPTDPHAQSFAGVLKIYGDKFREENSGESSGGGGGSGADGGGGATAKKAKKKLKKEKRKVDGKKKKKKSGKKKKGKKEAKKN